MTFLRDIRYKVGLYSPTCFKLFDNVNNKLLNIIRLSICVYCRCDQYKRQNTDPATAEIMRMPKRLQWAFNLISPQMSEAPVGQPQSVQSPQNVYLPNKGTQKTTKRKSKQRSVEAPFVFFFFQTLYAFKRGI